MSTPHLFAQTKPLSFLFIYPGGEGSDADAHPFIEAFLNDLSKKTGMHFVGKYFEEADEALETIRETKPQMGIVSLAFYLQEQNTVPMEILAKTETLGSGGTNEYTLFSHAGALSPGTYDVWCPEPLGQIFFEKIILKNISLPAGVHLKIKPSYGILTTLKRISSGELKALALLDSHDTQSLEKISLPWVKNLKKIHTSITLPSSPVVSFGFMQELTRKQIIAGLLNQRGSKPLSDLRLKGFLTAEKQEYTSLLQMLEGN
ncbi:MAG TPA: hypothetical protein DDW49_02330 [Deltaproteobacteria bacterium]|nr:hypothetical protein [Deltaproteobacteria bacterium]